MKLYDEWILNFPTKRNIKVVGDILSKAQSMLDYKIGEKMEVYNTFNEAYTSDAASFTNPKELYNYFKTYYELYKDGVHGVTMEKLFTKYEEVSEKFEIESTNLSKKLDLLIKKQESEVFNSREIRNKRIYESTVMLLELSSNLNAIISKEATCKNLFHYIKEHLRRIKLIPFGLKEQHLEWIVKNVQMILSS